MVNADRVAEHVELLCEGDGAWGDRADGFASGRTLVNTAVVFAGGLSVVKAFDAKWRGHATGDRRSERVLPKASSGDFFFE